MSPFTARMDSTLRRAAVSNAAGASKLHAFYDRRSHLDAEAQAFFNLKSIPTLSHKQVFLRNADRNQVMES